MTRNGKSVLVVIAATALSKALGSGGSRETFLNIIGYDPNNLAPTNGKTRTIPRGCDPTVMESARRRVGAATVYKKSARDERGWTYNPCQG